MADNQFVSYPCDTPKRWDEIAQWAYADPFKISPIINSNPNLQPERLVPAGTNVLVPIYDDSQDGSIPSSQKPPWAD